MSYWEPDDPPELPDGWLDEDTVAELQNLIKHYELPDPFPRPGNRNDAIIVMLDHILNPPVTIYGARLGVMSPPEDPNVTWAKILLKDIL